MRVLLPFLALCASAFAFTSTLFTSSGCQGSSRAGPTNQKPGTDVCFNLDSSTKSLAYNGNYKFFSYRGHGCSGANLKSYTLFSGCASGPFECVPQISRVSLIGRRNNISILVKGHF